MLFRSIVKATASDTSFNSAMNGLISITNRGGSYASLHNISASSYPIWDATRMVAGTDTPDANQPTESDIWDLIQKIAGRSGKDAMVRPKDFLLMTTPGLAKKLMESMVGQRRFTAGEFATTIKGGYKALEVCGIPMIQDYYVPAGTIYLLHIPRSRGWMPRIGASSSSRALARGVGSRGVTPSRRPTAGTATWPASRATRTARSPGTPTRRATRTSRNLHRDGVGASALTPPQG